MLCIKKTGPIKPVVFFELSIEIILKIFFLSTGSVPVAVVAGNHCKDRRCNVVQEKP